VSHGLWVDSYTGMTFTQASDLYIDHVVPLAHAHRTGGANWSREQKRRFANDPDNLLAVDDRTNQEKSDRLDGSLLRSLIGVSMLVGGGWLRVSMGLILVTGNISLWLL